MSGSWRTVRVFVSSTFRDMGAERDWLARVVFPELRERCAQRQLYLTDVDLRWGVTEEEAEQGKVLALCLEEIDRCRPFFLGLLGERYGWVPEQLPEEAVIEFPWVSGRQGHSVTELEILHGVLNNPVMTGRAFFFFRELSANIPLPADYQAETPEAADKLVKLKQRLYDEKFPVTGYACRWEGQVVGLEDFGKAVLEELWTAISEEYPEDAEPPDALTEEIELHETQAARLVAGFVGRTEEERKLTSYIESETHQALALTGPAGSGKSALLAHWALQYRQAHPEAEVVLHFVGASPSSTSHVQTMRRIGEELKRRLGLFSELPDKPEGLEEAFRNLLIEAGDKSKEPVVLVLDGLNQLEDIGGALGLAWVPDYLPAGVRILASTLEGEPLEALRRHQAEELLLAPLTTPERKQLVTDFLWEYRKKLSDAQLEALLANEATENALYLKVALEELRLFGSFEELTRRIESLPSSIEDLFGQVLDRVEGDHSGVFPVAEGLALLAASRSGLSERELLELLGGEVTQLAWARVRRSLAPYLVQRGELLDFAHRTLWKAVKATYGNSSERHLKLADYFLAADIDRRVTERPWQLEQTEAWEALKNELVSLEVMEWFHSRSMAHEWFAYWKPLEGKFEPGESCLEAAIREHDPYRDGRLAQVAGALLTRVGIYGQAERLCITALEVYQTQYGAEYPETLTSLNNLAMLWNETGEYAKALPLLEQVLATRERTLGISDPATVLSMNNLAVLCRQMGEYQQAASLYMRANALRGLMLSKEDPDAATSDNNLAELYRAQGRYDDALPLYERALRIREATLGPAHPDTAVSLSNLAELYRAEGQYEQALPLAKRALAIKKSNLGPHDPSIATSLVNLAAIYRELGDLELALPLIEEATEIDAKSLGEGHPSYSKDLNNLAIAYYARGEYERALPLLKQVITIRETQLGIDHPDTAKGLNNLASLRYALFDYEQALPLFERAVAIAEKALGPDHPNTKSFRANLEACRKALAEQG